MAKRREVLMRWFAEADLPYNSGDVPANGTIVKVVTYGTPRPGFPLREVWHEGVRYIANIAHLRSV